jgi:hypothetical protein
LPGKAVFLPLYKKMVAIKVHLLYLAKKLIKSKDKIVRDTFTATIVKSNIVMKLKAELKEQNAQSAQPINIDEIVAKYKLYFDMEMRKTIENCAPSLNEVFEKWDALTKKAHAVIHNSTKTNPIKEAYNDACKVHIKVFMDLEKQQEKSVNSCGLPPLHPRETRKNYRDRTFPKWQLDVGNRARANSTTIWEIRARQLDVIENANSRIRERANSVSGFEINGS